MWALLTTAGAFIVLLGLVVDGGTLLNDRLDAAHTADQAARAAADSLSESAARNGTDRLDPSEAARRARSYLRLSGHTGRVVVHGGSVTVSVTGSSPTRVLSIIGVDSLPVHETATAHGITSEEP